MEGKYRIYTVCYEGVKTYVIFTNMMEIVLLIFYSMGQEEQLIDTKIINGAGAPL